MSLQSIWLGLSLIGALVFPILRLRGYWPIRPYIKTMMSLGLALYCLYAPNTPLFIMATGFTLSALGDFFLDLPNDKGFLPGLIAFFAAHIAFLIYLWPHASFTSPYSNIIICTGLILATLVFYIWIRRSLPKALILPVAAYSSVITLMGMAALTTQLPSILIPIGAVLFITSDVVLSIEKFKTQFRFGREINWALYASGQILLAIGAVNSPPF